MTLAEENKLRKKMGLPPVKRITIATVKAEWKKKAKALPKEQRQRILDAIWAKVSPSEIAEQEGVDWQAVYGVQELNTRYLPYLLTETV